MNQARLLKLADLLEADAVNPKGLKFDLAHWANAKRGEPAIGCGTAACAIGLACLSPEFLAEGLKLTGVIIPAPSYGFSFGWDAVRKFFDVGDDEAEFLFRAGRYKESQQRGATAELAVARRIRDFVAGTVRP